MRFGKRADNYDRHATPQARVVARFAEKIPVAAPGETALELGAGTGLLTRELLAKGYRVTATDLSPAMVGKGRVAAPEADWRTLDAFAEPGGSGVPLIFSANLLQWADSPESVLRNLRARLVSGGRMHHAVLVSPTLAELHRLAGDAVPLRFRSAEAWLADATDAGLRILRAEIFSFRQTYPGARALLRDLHGTGAVSGKPRLGPGALRTLLRRYDAENAAPEGGVVATWAALIFEVGRDQ